MLYLYTGTDRERVRVALNAALRPLDRTHGRPEEFEGRHAQGKRQVIRITDANTLADLEASLRGEGMFGESRTIVFDGVLNNEEMRTLVESALPAIKDSRETFFILEERLDADTRRRIEKYAEKSERHDAAAKKRDGSVFDLGHALARGDKRALWIALQREYARGAAPEALHGVLFWGAKDFFMKSRAGEAQERARKLLATLTELPHEARRHGEELEYALERFALSGL